MGDVQDFHYTLLLVYTVDDLVISYPDALDVYIFELLHHSLVFFYGSGSAGVVGYTEKHDGRRNNPNPRVPPLRQH